MATVDDLAAQLTRVEGKVDAILAAVTTPPPPGRAPATPTGLTALVGADLRPVLTWDKAADATAWQVHDLLNPSRTLQATVTEPRSVRSPLKAGQHRRYGIVAVGAGGLSPMSATVDVPPDTPPPGGRYPAAIFGTGWYLTLPTGQPSHPDTIHQPQLATYSSKYCELTPAGDGVVFRCWHGGVTTSGSANPRSELRECTPDGLTLTKWSAAKGRHSMTVEGQVNRLTKVHPHVVVAQIHGADDDITVARVEGDQLWLTDGDDPHGYLLDSRFTLGKRYSIGIDVTDGVISYRYNGTPVPFTLRSSDAGCYYKTGNYLQSNPKSAPTESTLEYSEVVLYSVAVTHSA